MVVKEDAQDRTFEQPVRFMKNEVDLVQYSQQVNDLSTSESKHHNILVIASTKAAS